MVSLVRMSHDAQRSAYAAQMKADENAPGQFPARIGSYKLSRTWNENIFTGPLIFHWAAVCAGRWRDVISRSGYLLFSARTTR